MTRFAGSRRSDASRSIPYFPGYKLALTLALCLLSTLPAWAEDAHAAVGKLETAKSTLFARAKADGPWSVVEEKGNVHDGDLLLGMPGSVITSSNGAVRLTFWADLNETSPLPIIESAIVPHSTTKADFDFFLDRGRVDIQNAGEKPAKVHLRVHHHEVWELTLAEPGTRIALEMCGRWAPGTRFVKEPKPNHRPCMSLVVLVLSGKAHLKTGEKNEWDLSAPPGPAFFQWDCITGGDDKPEKLEKLPAWADAKGMSSPLAKKKQDALAKLQKLASEKSLDTAIGELLQSEDPSERALAARAAGATDNLQLLGDALTDGKYPDLWESAVVTLRHWIGRNEYQDRKLYDRLVEIRKMPPATAATFVQLLHSFDENDLSRPETYSTLIDYLNHERLAIRGLAHWHLVRLVPGGSQISYNPHASEKDHEKAHEEWKKLLPSGKVPAGRSSKDQGKPGNGQ